MCQKELCEVKKRLREEVRELYETDTCKKTSALLLLLHFVMCPWECMATKGWQAARGRPEFLRA